MNHLSGSDATFLHTESPEMPMHVGSLNVMDLPEGYTGDFFENAKAHMMERMHLADVFTRKLALMPFDLSNPVWVEDEDIDMDHHMRHVTLPKPGSNRQLQQLVARLHSSLLDRSRPLWEFFIIDGLKSGQVALYTKVHHAGIDGQAGVALGRAMFDTEATGRYIKPPRAKARRGQYQLGVAELAGAAIRNTVQQYVKLFKMAPAMAKASRNMLVPAKDESGKRDWSLPKASELFAPRTPLNVAITNQRSFAGRTVPLAEVKLIAKRMGASVNDVVMATTAGALRRYLSETNELPVKSLSAMVPVSLREAGDTTANNQVSMIITNLATDVADPAERLRKINESSSASKANMGRIKAAIPTDFPMFAAPWLMSGMTSMLGRSRLVNVVPPVANLVISNVAGIPAQLYFGGASVVSYYPVSIPAHGMALNVTVQSYNGRLDYGLIACRRALSDINELGDFMLSEHQILLDLAKAQTPTEAAAPVAAVAALPAPVKRKVATKVAKKASAKVALKRVPNVAVVEEVKAVVAPAKRARKAATRSDTPKIGLVA
ncbi:wax ester/triacylglycerol synthase family O-acyltransferase [soil metagenome]